MKNHIHILLKSKISRRIISIVLVIALVVGVMPMIEPGDRSDHRGGVLSVEAAGPYNTGPDPTFQHDSNNNNKITINLDDLVEYSQHYQLYPAYHQNDNVYISTSNSTVSFLEGFKSLGNADYSFSGSLSFIDNDTDTLALDVPLVYTAYCQYSKK